MLGENEPQTSSEYNQAMRIASGPRPDESHVLELLRRAHEKNDAAATYALATWYLYGKGGLKKNRRSAVKLLRIASKQGFPDAMYDLAVCYEQGYGVERDYAEAARHFLKAAIRGDEKAIFEVGRCLYYGIGVQKDRVLADIWLARAEELGTYVPTDQEDP